MTAYAIAHFKKVAMNPEIAEYLRRIDDTLEPFGGRFVVHGAAVEVIEGVWPGNIVIIEFPDLARAHAWYDSPDYRAILTLRLGHAEGDVIMVEGVRPGYRATELLKKREAAARAEAPRMP
jgi:uncharacterized protein (DUF1330 family)